MAKGKNKVKTEASAVPAPVFEDAQISWPEVPTEYPVEIRPGEIKKIVGELGAHDLGHVVRFADHEGVLARVLHEGGPLGPQPTYLRIYTEGMTSSVVQRIDHETPVTVLPLPPREDDL